MRPSGPLALPHIPATHAARATIWGAGIFGLAQGVGIILAGPDRWAGPSYTVIRQMAPPQVWGLVAIVAGALVLAGSIARAFTVKAVGLYLLAAWCTAFAGGALAALATVATAGTTGPPTYLLVAYWAAVLTVIDERRRPPAGEGA